MPRIMIKGGVWRNTEVIFSIYLKRLPHIVLFIMIMTLVLTKIG